MKLLIWLGAPLLTQQAGDGIYHAGQELRPLPGGEPPVITQGLRLLGIIAISGSIAAKPTADRAAVETLALADAHVIVGVDLVSLDLSQLSISHALHHFGQ